MLNTIVANCIYMLKLISVKNKKNKMVKLMFIYFFCKQWFKIHCHSFSLAVSPVEALHSLGPLLIIWGLCTVPNQGDWGSCWPTRRRIAGEAKGLSTSGVKGAVKVLFAPPTDDLKTEPGVLSGTLSRGVSAMFSVPDTTTDKTGK